VSEANTELTERLGYVFSDVALLKRALTHRSKGANNNERLEFLGDSILNFIIAMELYDRYPALTEGELTRVRASLVKKETLAELARELGLGNFLELGGGECKSGGHERDSILADGLEAIFGAVFKDRGFAQAKAVILKLYQTWFADLDPQTVLKDPKTRLQEYLQQQSLRTPAYNILEVFGEPHQQNFIVECRVPGLAKSVQGQGSSRRKAEQQAASKALEILSSEADV
jgi:ribonuclease-3